MLQKFILGIKICCSILLYYYLHRPKGSHDARWKVLVGPGDKEVTECGHIFTRLHYKHVVKEDVKVFMQDLGRVEVLNRALIRPVARNCVRGVLFYAGMSVHEISATTPT